MSYFKKARKYNKPSITLDEKIAKANQEYAKTNVLLEGPTNSTSGLYFASQQVEGTPAVMTPVPDNTGFGGGGSQNANGGDQNDSGTWDNGWQSTDDMRNSDTLHGVANRPIPLTPDLSGWNGTGTSANSINFGPNGNAGGEASGIAIYTGAQGQACIGSVGGGNIFTQILVGDAVFGGYAYPADQSGPSQGGYYGSYTDSEFGAAQNLAVAYEANKNNGGVTRLCWVPYGTVNSGSYANYSGTKKTTNFTTPSYPDGYSQQWALHPVTILNGQNTYESQAAVPAHTTIVYQDDLGNGEYLNMSGFQNLLKGLFGLGKSALDWLLDNASPTGIIGNAVDDSLGIGADLLGFLSDVTSGDIEGAAGEVLGDLANGISNLAKEGEVFLDYLAGNHEDGSINNEYLGQEVVNDIIANAPGSGVVDGKFVANDKIVGTGGTPTIDNSSGEGDDRIATFPFSYDFETNAEQVLSDPSQWENPDNGIVRAIAETLAKAFGGNYGYDAGQVPFAGWAVWVQKLRESAQGTTGHSITMSLADIKILNPDLYLELVNGNYAESYKIGSQLLTEKNHLRDLREKKREKTKKVADRITKINIPGPKDHLTVRAIDMLRQYKVSPKEMQEYVTTIGEINQWIRDNPKEYEIWKVRYPANDPRTAELNWRMDQQLKASAEYVESRFPENKRLFTKLKDKIQANIDVTSPENFKGITPVVTHKRLLSVSRAIET